MLELGPAAATAAVSLCQPLQLGAPPSRQAARRQAPQIRYFVAGEIAQVRTLASLT
jgi:hypothetical protein